MMQKRENFYTLREMSGKIERLAMQAIKDTEEQVELKRSYASAHTEDALLGRSVGSPQDARCRYFCPSFNIEDMEE